jgi:Mg-chelatase subunit ChlD
MADSDRSVKLSFVLTPAKTIVLILIALLLSLIIGGQIASAQGQPVIEVTGTDISEFPIVRVTFIAVDGRGNRMDILPGLALNEDGRNVEILNQSETEAGFEYIFVIDANESYDLQDQADGLTRREMVRESILDFANNFMNKSQLDKVSIIVPGEEEAVVLVDRSQFHTELINEINFYEPEDLAETPLQVMLDQALLRAAESRADGKAQAIILFTDGGQLSEQLDYEALVPLAQEIGVPIHSVIIGASADDDEIENVLQLGEPTGGSFVHLEIITSTNPIYTALQNNGIQNMVEYRSQINSAGDHTISVQTTVAEGSTDVSVDVAPPGIELAVDNSLPIRRVLDSADAPVTDAEPSSQPIVARVTWPDGYLRAVSEVALIVDGVEQTVIEDPEIDDNGLLSIDWDLESIDEGTYALVIRATDELGIEGESAELPMTIEVARPEPPAEVETEIQPTAVPAEPEDSESTGLVDNLGIVGIAIGGAALFALFCVIIVAIVLVRRRKPAPIPAPMPAGVPDGSDATQVMMPAFAAPKAPTAYLEPLENAPEHSGMIALSGENIAIGRDENLAQIVFNNKSVSRLHARIMLRGGVFQIYDEGSASGTYVNYEQVSLTPQTVQDNDDVHFGQVHCRFHVSGGAPDDDSTQIMQAPSRPGGAPSPVADDMSTQPYMPNQPPLPGQPAPSFDDDDEDDTSTQPYMPHSPRR